MDLAQRAEFIREAERVAASVRSPAEAIEILGAGHWMHSFQLSDGTVINGGKSLASLQAHYDAILEPLCLSGQSVLDVGAWTGAFSFECKRRGAARVVSTDMYTWISPIHRGLEKYLYIRSALGMDTEFALLDVRETTVEIVGKFNVVLFLGVFYHLQDPLAAIEQLARVADPWLVIETYLDLEDLPYPAMRYYPRGELAHDNSNWWGPNSECVSELLRTHGFSQITFSPFAQKRGVFHARQ
jgi:tRNA (mo5U34)-methyltransferase